MHGLHSKLLPDGLLQALPKYWIICTLLILAFGLRTWFKRSCEDTKPDSSQIVSPPPEESTDDMLYQVLSDKAPVLDRNVSVSPPSPRRVWESKKRRHISEPTQRLHIKSKQPYDAFLILDVEATCQQGSSFDYPSEIIEFPVCLLRWKDKTKANTTSQLELVDEFRSFVKPSWRPTLSQFCTDLTGITQEQVDSAPSYRTVTKQFRKFLVKNGLIDPKSGKRLMRFCWCTDGPYDVQDFIVKQCFISKLKMPEWMKGDVLDVRILVGLWLSDQPNYQARVPICSLPNGVRRPLLNIPSQLQILGLPPFEGKQHSGIDDTRNIARIVTELARKGVRLLPNTAIQPNRRWQWMGKRGQILEEYIYELRDILA